MCTNSPKIGWLKISGSTYEIGLQLGLMGRSSVHDNLIGSDYWKKVNALKYRNTVRKLIENSEDSFPDIVEEIRGLADGLELPFEDVFAWNCRGDLLSNVPDGCTTVQIPLDGITIAHNEDGLPFFDSACFIAEVGEVEGERQSSFLSFAYPGSILGHTFGLTSTGMAMAANNLRLKGVIPEIPRMVLARAMLNCKNIDEIRFMLQKAPKSGGFHYSVAQQGDGRLFSIEFGNGQYSERLISKPSLHANHVIQGHVEDINQTITQSSRDRQARGAELLNTEDVSALSVLQDKGGKGLPILRQEPDDPDNENTLASAVFNVTKNGVKWSIYEAGAEIATYDSEQRN